MIRSKQQCQVSREQLARLQQVRAAYEATPQPDPLVQAALLTSVNTLIGDVEEELAEYRSLIAGDAGRTPGKVE